MNITKNSLPKQIANSIEQEIKDGVFKVGDKIPTEPELVKKYGVSRNTVREAVQALIQVGILEAKQGSGVFVVANDRLQVDFFNLLGNAEKNNVIEVRSLLEEYIVESAILHATETDLLEIEQKLSIRNNIFNEIKEYTNADIDFHISIANATHNIILVKMYKYVSQFFVEFISFNIETHLSQQKYIDDLHNSLFNEIKDKNTQKAKEIVKEIINL